MRRVGGWGHNNPLSSPFDRSSWQTTAEKCAGPVMQRTQKTICSTFSLDSEKYNFYWTSSFLSEISFCSGAMVITRTDVRNSTC